MFKFNYQNNISNYKFIKEYYTNQIKIKGLTLFFVQLILSNHYKSIIKSN